MKIQCSCGTKYAFETSPDMVRTPVQLVCEKCGQDNSAAVNQLIRTQYGVEQNAPSVPSTPSTPSTPPAASPLPPPPPPPAEKRAPMVVKVGVRTTTTQPTATEPAPAADVPQACLKHGGQLTTHQCLVCQKPMCPQCMQITGYVCSAFCRTKGENKGMAIPAFAGQRDATRSREWKKVGRIVTLCLAVPGVIFGTWFWYEWFGSVPRVVSSIDLPGDAIAGQFQIYPENQIILLHAGTLARHDSEANLRVWSTPLIDKKAVAARAAESYEAMRQGWRESAAAGMRGSARLTTLDELTAEMQASAAAALELYVHDQAIWVYSPDQLSRFDWHTGEATREISLSNTWGRAVQNNEELFIVSGYTDAVKHVTQVDLGSGRLQATIFGQAAVREQSTRRTSSRSRRRGTRRAPATQQTQADNEALDPAEIASRVDRLSTPKKLALPATLAVNANQRRLATALRDDQTPPGAAKAQSTVRIEPYSGQLFPTSNGLFQLSTVLLQSKVIERKVMREAPKNSALDGPLNARTAPAAINELLNEMQRDGGHDVVLEDVSRYRATVRHSSNKNVEPWTGDLEGSPDLFPLQTVNVVSGGKSVVVLDRNNKKLWSLKLNYNLHRPSTGRLGFTHRKEPFGAGPCVERQDTLYIFDQGTLTACELKTGKVRWRLPSVGTQGLFFDDEGMMYVNTSTATPDSIKYSNQIDIDSRVFQLVLKVDPSSGTVLWGTQREGSVAYISGNFLYTVDAHAGNEPEEDELIPVGIPIPPHVRIKRLSRDDGRVLWEHYEKQAPLQIQFDQNSFHVMFANELQFLRFLTF